MRKTNCLIIVALLFFSGVACCGVASAQIEVSPPTIELDLIGGDTVTEQIIITWKGEAAVVGFIETDITPDGEGINVTYSENPVILYPGIPKTLDMTINISINIMPGNYTIEMVALTEIDEIIKYETIYKTIYAFIDVENLTKINELMKTIQQLQEEINQTTDYTDLLPLITALLDTFGDLVTAIEDALGEEPEPEKEEYDFLAIILFFILITILNLSIVFYHL